jgi:hypothetical protein
MEEMGQIRSMALIAVVFFTLGAPAVFAARPLITDDTGTVEKGAFELELAFDFLRDEDENDNYFPSVQLKYGLSKRAEVGASIGYIRRDASFSENVDGWADVLAYLKYRLWQEGNYFPSMALKPLIKFPTASSDKGLGSGKIDYGIGPIFSKSYSDFSFHLEAIYFFIGEKRENDTLSTGAAMEYEFLKGWTAVGEVRYANNFNSDRHDDPLLVNFGLKKAVGRAVLDAAFNVGLNRAAPDYGFTAGVTIGF